MKIRRLIAILLCLAAALGLGGCGGVFDREYVAVSDYEPSQANISPDTEKITVRSFSELRSALLLLVSEGERESRLVFDAAYEGEVTEDMANACWQVRSQDALCAYCVENIAYDLSKIVTYYEANVTISYSQASVAAEDVVKLSYTTGLEELIGRALDEAETRLAVLIDRSMYSAEEVEGLVAEAYRQTPALAPREPSAAVKMYSGNGMQRLYEIRLDYGADAEELRAFREAMAALSPFGELDTENMDEAHRALAASRYIAENIRYSEEAGGGISDALIGGEANSEGMAFAFVELCRRLGLECRVIYGQRNWQDYCWNIVQVDGSWYHVDNVLCATEGYWTGFLLRDEDIWNNYRWDVSAYPRCSGTITYAELFGAPEENPA